jgi:hypothetical protein
MWTYRYSKNCGFLVLSSQKSVAYTVTLGGLPGGESALRVTRLNPALFLVFFWSTLDISLAISLALPSIVLLPLSSPYTFMPVLMISPAGLPVAMAPTTPRAEPGDLPPLAHRQGARQSHRR